MSASNIEWTDETWNPVGGCRKVSPGCKNCYAETMAARHVLMSAAQGRQSPYLPVVDAERRRWNGRAVTVPERLADPLSWRKPRRVFVNSMSDLFHEDVPFEFIAAVFGVMAATGRHTYQVLTKRPAQMLEFFAWLAGQHEFTSLEEVVIYGSAHVETDLAPLVSGRQWPLPNVWLGVSVEDQATADERIPLLLQAPAAVRFLSCEPFLGPIDLAQWIRRIDHCGSCGAENQPQEPDACPECGATSCLLSTWGEAEAERYCSGERYTTPEGDADVAGGSGLGWVIAGGESGPNARPCDLAWLRSIVSQCAEAGVACFVKQLGARPMLDGVSRGRAKGTYVGDLLANIKHPKGGDIDEWPADLRVRQWPEVRCG